MNIPTNFTSDYEVYREKSRNLYGNESRFFYFVVLFIFSIRVFRFSMFYSTFLFYFVGLFMLVCRTVTKDGSLDRVTETR